MALYYPRGNAAPIVSSVQELTKIFIILHFALKFKFTPSSIFNPPGIADRITES